MKDDSLDGDETLEPEELATDAVSELKAAIEELTAVVEMLETESVASPTTITNRF